MLSLEELLVLMVDCCVLGFTPLYMASQYGDADVVQELLRRGADADKATTTEGCTPMFIASKNGHADVVKLLLEHGADVDMARTTDGTTPLIKASQKGHTDVVKLLLEHGADADKATTDVWGYTPLWVASCNGYTDVVRLLLEHGADADKAITYDGTTPLWEASEYGYTDVVQLLLEHGADANKEITEGVAPLYAASHDGYADVVTLLLEHGADADKAPTGSGYTPLIAACEHGNVDVVRRLLEHGADASKPSDGNFFTPLTVSAASLEDAEALSMVQLLAMAGADIEHTNDDDETAAMIAAAESLPLTAAWLGAVTGFSRVQIIVSLGNGDALRKLARQQEFDPFTRTRDTPALTELATGDASLLRLCREVRMRWAPVRHQLFHSAHRSTVLCVLLVSRCGPSHGLGGSWIRQIPTEVWFAIIEQLGRMGWSM